MNTELEINLENLSQNIRNLRSLLKPATDFIAGKTERQTLFMAVVKANAYGHGIVEVSRAAVQAGADWLGVINIDEAILLREANIHKPILILGQISHDDFRTAANKDVSVPIISKEMAREVAEINFDKPLKIHLKIDTGLNRLGIANNEIAETVRILSSHRNIIIEGVYSHLAAVEEANVDYAKMQINNFREAIKILKQNGIDNVIKHIAASAATMVLKDSHFDMVRCGIAIYGLWPSGETKGTFKNPDFLKPILNYKTSIIQIKKVEKGGKIGYGCSFEADEDMTIGIIPVGYAEGIDRGLSNNIGLPAIASTQALRAGEVLVSGQRCPIIGRICMNMTIIELKVESEKLKVGQEVTIIGKDGDEEITVDKIAEKLGTINYEIVARIPEHIERRYI